jgi:hypothetical protein
LAGRYLWIGSAPTIRVSLGRAGAAWIPTIDEDCEAADWYVFEPEPAGDPQAQAEAATESE